LLPPVDMMVSEKWRVFANKDDILHSFVLVAYPGSLMKWKYAFDLILRFLDASGVRAGHLLGGVKSRRSRRLANLISEFFLFLGANFIMACDAKASIGLNGPHCFLVFEENVGIGIIFNTRSDKNPPQISLYCS
jgi:hypothetical protein